MKTFKRMATAVFIIYCLVPDILQAQDILTDKKGDVLFNMPTALTAPKITSTTLGVTIPLINFKATRYFVTDDNTVNGPNKTYTVVKSNTIYLDLAAINNTGTTLDFSSKPNITPHVELGISRSIDSFIDPKAKGGTYWTWSLAAFADYQHFSIYDQATKSLTENGYKKISPGLKGIVDVFYKDQLGLAFSGSYQKNVNTDLLTSFQKITSDFYADAVVAANGNVDGYFSPVTAKDNFRFSVALLYLKIPALQPKPKLAGDSSRTSWPRKLLEIAQIMPAPYYYINSPNFKQVGHNAGITISFIPNRIYHATNYTIGSALSIGYNLINSSDKGNQRFLFLSGTFSFGDLKTPEDDKENK